MPLLRKTNINSVLSRLQVVIVHLFFFFYRGGFLNAPTVAVEDVPVKCRFLHLVFVFCFLFFFSYRPSITPQHNIVLLLMSLHKKQQLVWPKSVSVFSTPFFIGKIYSALLPFLFLDVCILVP